MRYLLLLSLLGFCCTNDEIKLLETELGNTSKKGLFRTEVKHSDENYTDLPIYCDVSKAPYKEYFIGLKDSLENTTIRMVFEKGSYLAERDSFSLKTFIKNEKGEKIVPEKYPDGLTVWLYRTNEFDDTYEYRSQRVVGSKKYGKPLFFSTIFELADQDYEGIIIVPIAPRGVNVSLLWVGHNYLFPFELAE